MFFADEKKVSGLIPGNMLTWYIRGKKQQCLLGQDLNPHTQYHEIDDILSSRLVLDPETYIDNPE
jgi:hypothetical protein